MEIQFYGANCIKISTKKSTVVIDDDLSSLGGKDVAKAGDIVLSTSRDIAVNKDKSLIFIDGPGEFEVSDMSIKGITARSHMDQSGVSSATIYRIECADLRVAVVGHIHPDLDEKTLEEIGIIDILLVPVGGSGYTLDPIGAKKVITEINPRIIIPTHYSDGSLNYEVAQTSLDEALKTIGSASETVSKFKPKVADLDEASKVVVLERQ